MSANQLIVQVYVQLLFLVVEVASMVGGEGAKERRRLLRQHSQSNNDEKTKKEINHSVPVRGKAPFTKKNSLAKRPTPTQKVSAKKKKVNKPKHLKRKLEQLSVEDEQTREIVLKEIAEFEDAKTKNTQNNPKKKRPKRSEGEGENYREPRNAPITKKMKVYDMEIKTVTNETNDTSIDVVETKPATINKHKNLQEKVETNDDTSLVGGSDHENEKDNLRRERGRRRRGRKDTAKQIKETQTDKEAKPEGETREHVALSTEDELDKKRYCIGRKPVSDFVMGQKYQGKVVYVKDFGVFLDIGCHSDAFCHVSRLKDDFVEDPHVLFKEGDEVEARVVEIDRKHKRITVSFQSDERVADERASMEAREKRKKVRNESRRKIKRQEGSQENVEKNDDEKKGFESEKKKSVVDETRSSKDAISKDPTPIHKPSQEFPSRTLVTPADEKRARKLARRAARREQPVEGES